MGRARAVGYAVGGALAALSLGLGAALPAAGQTVSPVIVEYHGAGGAGNFNLNNDSMQTLVVTLEPKSFAIDRDGKGEFRKLDATTHVSFSETSVRLPPKSRRTVYYKASAAAYPAWFSVYAIFHGLPKQNGVNVQLELPHTVYLLGDAKQSKAARGDLQLEDVRVADGILSGSVVNRSGKMLRVEELAALQAGHAKVAAGGFPLLPGGVHDFRVKLAGVESPARVSLHYGGVAVEQGTGNRE